MQFTVEQIALFPLPGRREIALELLSLLGFTHGKPWVTDTVEARGEVWGRPARSTGQLAFAYQALTKPLEIEVLAYDEYSPNWMEAVPLPAVSHLGMHCSSAELDAWNEKMTALHIGIAQTVITDSHTNPAIAGTRRYNYVIYDTRAIIGVDLKFIVRYDAEMNEYMEPGQAEKVK